MLCPYCKSEMLEGVIHSPNELNWIPGEKRKFISSASVHWSGSVVLSKRSFVKGSACRAYNCPSCQKIIIDYGDDKTDFNN